MSEQTPRNPGETEADYQARLQFDRQRAIQRKAMMLADELNLTRDDRHELSIMVVGKDKNPSWSKFTDQQWERACDYLVGFTYIYSILHRRGAIERTDP